MIEPSTRAIDGFEFTVTPLPAMRAMKLLRRLMSAAGPAVAEIADAAGSKGDIASADVSKLGAAAARVFDRFSEADFEAVTKELLYNATIGGALLFPRNFDIELQGKVGTILKLLGFALEVNYGDFFGGLLAAGKKRSQQEAPTSETSTT